ncbi:MAG: hypothetical protein DWQ04_18410 [Chloroflexi bacterium]|nr:MAG: hypothetical protein DWQ04_18410 [Chloroflexota bacterium]
MELQITLAIVVIVVLMLLLLRQRIRAGRTQLVLRPLSGYSSLKQQVAQAIETGSKLHISIGQAGLIGPDSATSIAATQIVNSLAKEGCANGTPPLVTVGEGTLLPLAQTQIRAAYENADRIDEFDTHQAVFVASESDSMAYAGGVATEIFQNKIASNVLAGRFNEEVAIMAEAGTRKQVEQVIGSNNPIALAVATAVTDNILIGEELLVAGAYLESKPVQLASVQLQDILRWVIVLAIIALAIIEMFT